MKIRLSKEELYAVLMEKFGETAQLAGPMVHATLVLREEHTDQPIPDWYVEINVDKVSAPR